MKKLLSILIILLIIHLIANHLVAQGGLFQWIDVVNYYQVAIVPIMEILFLILVVTHSLLGLRSVILDLKPARSVLKVVDVLFVCAGGISIVYGIWLVLTIISIGKGV